MRILVVEDEERIAHAIKRTLEGQLFEVDTAFNADTGLELAVSRDYDLVILDRMLPNRRDGAFISSALRAGGSHVPILMLTAKIEVYDRVEGLDLGADDYLAKPFDMAELIARVRALLRRPRFRHPDRIAVASLSVSTITNDAFVGEVRLQLTATEFKLLRYLMYNKGKVVTKDQLLAHVWDEVSPAGPNTVEVYISRLRSKIQEAGTDEGKILETVHGFGYKIAAGGDV